MTLFDKFLFCSCLASKKFQTHSLKMGRLSEAEKLAKENGFEIISGICLMKAHQK